MKKTIFFVLLLMCSALNSAIKAEEVTVNGKIEGIKKGRLFLITRSSEEKTDTLGFCDFKRGKFSLEATIAEPVVAHLLVEGFSGGFMLFAEPGVAYQAYLSEGDNFYIRGGLLNDSYTSHMRVSDSLNVVIAGMQGRYDAMRVAKKFRSASQVNDSLRREQDKLRRLTTAFLDGNDNLIMAYTLYSNIVMRDASLGETRRLYNTLGR